MKNLDSCELELRFRTVRFGKLLDYIGRTEIQYVYIR